MWVKQPPCAQEAAKAQEELAAAEFDGYSSDETVRVVMSGNQEPKSVDITEEAIASGAEVSAAQQKTGSSGRPKRWSKRQACSTHAGQQNTYFVCATVEELIAQHAAVTCAKLTVLCCLRRTCRCWSPRL